MELSPEVNAAVAASHARDKESFQSLGPVGRAVATRLGMFGFWLRRFLGWFGWHTLRKSEYVLGAILDKALWLGDKVIFGPYRALVRGIVRLARATAGGLKLALDALLWGLAFLLRGLEQGLSAITRRLSGKEGSGRLVAAIAALARHIERTQRILVILRRRWRRAIDRAWVWLQASTVDVLGLAARGMEWAARNLLFRPCVWAFDPRFPGGRPLLVSENLNRLVGFALAALALYLGALILAYIKTKALILHGTINTALWNANASHVANILKIGLVHASISFGVAMSKFVLLPVIAAARRGMKNNRFTQAIAYQYARRLWLAEHRDHSLANAAKSPEAAAAPPRKPLKFLETLTRHIISGTVPEAYEVQPGKAKHAPRPPSH